MGNHPWYFSFYYLIWLVWRLLGKSFFYDYYLHFFIFLLTCCRFSYILKCSLYIGCILCRSFKIYNISVIFAPLLSFCILNLILTIIKTFLSLDLSNLLPRTTKGKFSGSFGCPCIKNSSLQLSKESND